MLLRLWSQDGPTAAEGRGAMSETQTQTLSAWLLERIAEDEAEAKKAARLKIAGPLIGWHPDSYFLVCNDALAPAERTHIARHDPARVLAECEAKRRIVGFAEETLATEGHGFPADDSGYEEAHSMANATLRALALPYADRPDYQETWRV